MKIPRVVRRWKFLYFLARARGMSAADAREWAGAVSRIER